MIDYEGSLIDFDGTLLGVARSINDRPTNIPTLRQGVVIAVAVSSCSVKLAGSTVVIANVKALNSYVPAVNDAVFIVQNGPDLLILGPVGNPGFLAGVKIEANDLAYTPWKITGSKGGYSGFRFGSHALTFMVSTGATGIYTDAGAWKWYFDGSGALAGGTVPGSQITGVLPNAVVKKNVYGANAIMATITAGSVGVVYDAGSGRNTCIVPTFPPQAQIMFFRVDGYGNRLPLGNIVYAQAGGQVYFNGGTTTNGEVLEYSCVSY